MTPAELSDARWRRSSYSGGAGNGGNCVEIAHMRTSVVIRDAKAPQSGALHLTQTTWSHFSGLVRQYGCN